MASGRKVFQRCLLDREEDDSFAAANEIEAMAKISSSTRNHKHEARTANFPPFPSRQPSIQASTCKSTEASSEDEAHRFPQKVSLFSSMAIAVAGMTPATATRPTRILRAKATSTFLSFRKKVPRSDPAAFEIHILGRWQHAS
mmetsp:Transcript_18013/g.44834  ORF Transcript_18013/g.44834 Transcript_18013/m.44834 type:complete len:143 (+) Transcript_18013:133-561(+)